MSNDKFFGNVGNDEESTDNVLPLETNEDVVTNVLNTEEDIPVGATVTDEASDTVVVNATDHLTEPATETTPTELPFSTVGYFRNNSTGQYHLVTIDFNPVTGEVGPLNVDPDRTAMDRLSIEEEFRIAAVHKVFSR